MPALPASHGALGVERLRWGKYSPAYRKRLLEGCSAFSTFLAEAGVGLEAVLQQKSSTVDEIMEQFIRTMHDSSKKSSLRVAKHALLTLQILRPRLRRKMQASWNAVKSWEEQQPVSFRAPLPLALLMAIVCKALLLSEQCNSEKEAQLWRALSTLLLVGFFGLLRPGELFGLKAQDAVAPNSLTMGSSFAVVRVARPKNSRQMGVQQYVEIRRPDAVNWLTWLKGSRPAHAALWASTPSRFRSMFKKVCCALKVDTLRLSPASLRAGGATWLVDEGVEISRVRFLGRWAHLRSLEHYIQVAKAQQIALAVAPGVAADLKKFISKYHFLIHLPAFLACTVPNEHLLCPERLPELSPGHAIAAARAWGRSSQTIPKSGGERGALERGTIH